MVRHWEKREGDFIPAHSANIDARRGGSIAPSTAERPVKRLRISQSRWLSGHATACKCDRVVDFDDTFKTIGFHLATPICSSSILRESLTHYPPLANQSLTATNSTNTTTTPFHHERHPLCQHRQQWHWHSGGMTFMRGTTTTITNISNTTNATLTPLAPTMIYEVFHSTIHR